MATDLDRGTEASVTQLVKGIIADALELGQQQLALLRYEVQQDCRTARASGVLLIGGLATALVGSILCALMLVHLLSWAVPELPLWVGYGLLGAPIAGLGGALLWAGIHKIESMNLLLDRSAQAFKENLQWKTGPK